VSATANHHGSSATTAKGDGVGGSTAVGAAIALGFVDDSAVASTARNITANGAVSFTASADGSSKSTATASAAGADKSKEDAKGNKTADDQSKSAAGLATKQSGETKKADDKKASTDDGNGGGDSVSVGAALALNVASSHATAAIGNGLTIVAGEGLGTGALSLKAENNMDASAIADGSAAKGSSDTAVGIAIAINIADMQNDARIGTSTVTADGVSVQALMKDVGGNKTHTFAAKATSGASGDETGVAGSFALNYQKAQSDAEIVAGALVNAGTGDVTLKAENTTNSTVEAKAASSGGETGVGVSVGINIAVDNDTRANLNGTLNGGDDVTLTATGSHVVNTTAEGGGTSKKDTGVGGGLALTVADNDTEAKLGAGAALNVTGAVSATANHHGSSATTAKGDGVGGSTAVGAAIALGFVDDSAVASTARNITANGAVSFTASADGSSKSEAIASAKGTTKDAESSKGTTADDQSKSGAGLATKQSGESKSAGSDKSSASSESGSVSVAAALALNIANNSALATVNDGLTIVAGDGGATGSLNLHTSNLMSAAAIGQGVAGTTADGDAVGIGIGVNVAQQSSEASVGAGATITADGLEVEADMATRDVGMTVASVTVVDTGSEKLFLGAGHGLKTGDEVTYDKGAGGNTAVGGLTDGDNYFVRVEDGGYVTFYDTEDHAKAGGATGRVDLTSGGTGNDHKLSHGGILGIGDEEILFDPATPHRVVDLGAGHNLRTGDAIVYENGGGASASGLQDGKTYYVIVLDDDRVELADSLENAIAGKAVTLTGNGTGSQKLIDQTHTFRAEAVSGASGGNTGVAGSLAFNYASTNTQAVVGLDHGAPSGVTTVTLGGGDVGIRAENFTETTVSAKPDGIAQGADTGVGASIALNISLNRTVAQIEDGETVSGSAQNFIVAADSANTAYTYSAGGAAGDGTAVGGAISLAYVENETLARIGSGAGGTIALNGDLGVSATHRDSVISHATGEAAGDGTAVGIALALNIVQDDTKAELSRNFSGAHDVDVESTSIVMTEAEARASAAGSSSQSSKDENKDGNVDADDKTRNSDGESSAQSDFIGNRSGSSNKAAPSQDTSSSLGKANEGSESQSGNSSDSNGGTSVAASVAVNYLEADNSARIADGVTVNATGNLDVIATAVVDTSAQGLSTSTNTSSDTGVAAAVGLNIALASNTASVGDNADLTADSIDVRAVLPSSNAANTFQSRALAGAVSSGDGVGGSISVNFLDLDTHASIGDNAKVNATAGNVRVEAVSHNDIQNIAGGAGISLDDGAGVGVAIAVNIIADVDPGEEGKGLDTSASVGTGAIVDATGSISVTADANLLPMNFEIPVINQTIAVTSFAAGIAASGGGDAVGGSSSVNVYFIDTQAYIDDNATVTAGQNLTVEAKDKLTLFSAAGGLAVSGGGSGVGIGLDVGVINRSTTAWAGSGADLKASSGNLKINAESADDLTSIAATFGVGGDSVGLAASIGVQVLLTETRAYVEDTPAGPGGTLTAGGTLSVTAKGDLEALMIGGSVGVGNSAGIGISSTVFVHDDDVEARFGNRNIANSGGDASISASSSEELIALTVAGSGGGTVGVSVSPTINVLTETTHASVGRGATVNAQHVAGTPNLSVTATDTTQIVSVAGSVAVGGTAGVGVGADVLSLTKDTQAFIDSGVNSQVDGNIDVSATSSERITSVAAGIAVGGTAGVSVNAGVHVLDLTTRAYIGDDPDSGPGSLGAGDVHAGGTVRIAADDVTEMDKVAATVAIGGSAGVGAAATVTVIDKTTEAFIGAGAKVTGDGNTVGLSAATGGFGVTFAAANGPATREPTSDGAVHTDTERIDIDGGSDLATGDYVTYSKGGESATAIGGLEDNRNYFVRRVGDSIELYDTKEHALDGGSTDGRVNLTSAGSGSGRFTPTVEVVDSKTANNSDIDTLSNAGQVTTPNVDPVDTDGDSGGETTDPTANANRVLTPQTVTVRGVAVSATSRDDIGTYSVGLAGGTVGVAVAAAVNVVNTETTAYIGDGAQVNVDQSNANAAQSVLVGAGSDFHHVAVAAGAGFGAVGVAPGVDVTVVGSTTHASIDANAKVYAKDDVAVAAHASEDVLMIGMGIAAGTVGVGGGVSVLTINNETHASIAGKVSAGGDVVISATDDTSITLVSGALGAGFVGVGASVGVGVVTKDTQAFIDNNAMVDARGQGVGVFALTGALEDNGGIPGDADDFADGERHGVIVEAQSSERLTQIGIAVGAGFVGVSGAVDVAVIDSDTRAWIGNADINQTDAKTIADSDQGVFVGAANEARVFSFAGAVAGGFVGVGAAVNVGVLKNDVNAEIRSGATVTAKGDIEANALAIKDIDGMVIAGAGGFVGVAGAVSVWSVGTTLEANYTDDSGNNETNSLEVIKVEFDPGDVNTGSDTIDVGADHGLVTGDQIIYRKGDGNTAINGLADGQTYFVRMNGNQATLYDTSEHATAGGATGRINLTSTGSGSDHAFALTAEQDAGQQGAHASGQIQGELDSFGNGTAEVTHAFDPGNVDTANETIDLGSDHGLETGDQIVYRNGNGSAVGGLVDGKTYFVRISGDQATLYDTYSHATASPSTTGRINLTSAGTGTGHELANPDDPSQMTNTRLFGITSDGSSRLGSSGPSAASLTSGLATPVTTGTSAVIANGSQVSSTDGEITVNAREDVEINQVTGGVAAGAVGVGAGISVVSLASNVSASAGGTLSADDALTINAMLDERVVVDALAAGAGAVGLGAAVAVVIDTSTVSAAIADNAVVSTAGSIAVNAESKQVFDVLSGQVTVGAGAVGASFVKVKVGNDTPGVYETLANVGDGTLIGQSGSVGSLQVSAESTVDVVSNVVGLAGGAGVAVTANFNQVDVNPDVRARIGDNAKVTTQGAIDVDADTHADVFADVIGVGGAGGLAVALSFVDVSVTPAVSSVLGTNAQAKSTGAGVNFRARHNAGPGDENRSVEAQAIAASGAGIAAGAGALSEAVHTATVSATGGTGSLISSAGASGMSTSNIGQVEGYAKGGSGSLLGSIAFMSSTMTSGGSSTVSFDGSVQDSGVTPSSFNLSASAERIARTEDFVIALGGAFGGAGAVATASASGDTTATFGANSSVSIGGNLGASASSTNLATANTEGGAGGLLGGAAIFDSYASAGGKTEARMADGAEVLGAGNVSIASLASNTAAANTTAGSGGFVSAGGTQATVSVTPTVTSAIGSNSKLQNISGSVNVTAESAQAEGDATAAAFGGGVVQIGVATANGTVTPTVSAAIGSGTTIVAGGNVVVSASSGYTPGGEEFGDTFNAGTGGERPTSYTTDVINFNEHGLATGDSVVYQSNGNAPIKLAGADGAEGTLVDGRVYNVIVRSDDTLSLGNEFKAGTIEALQLFIPDGGVTQGVDGDRDMVRFAIPHNFANGDAVRYDHDDGDPGIGIAEGTYYVRIVDDFTIKLFANRDDALNDGARTFGVGSVTGDDQIILAGNTFNDGDRLTYRSPVPVFFKANTVERTIDGNGVIDGFNNGNNTIYVGTDVDNNGIIEGHTFATGDKVVYRTDDPGLEISGLNDGQTYYVIVIDDYRVRLSETLDGTNPDDDDGGPNIGVTPVSINGSGTDADNAANRVNHWLVRPTLGALQDGVTYQVINKGGDGDGGTDDFQLAAIGSNVALDLDDSARSGTFTLSKAGLNLTPGSAGDTHELVIDLKSGSGQHVLLGEGEVSLRTISPPPGDGLSAVSASGGGGGLIAGGDPDSKIVHQANVDANLDAASVAIGGDVTVDASASGNLSAFAKNAGGGFVQVGNTDATVVFAAQTDAAIGDGTEIEAEGNVFMDATNSVNAKSYSRAVGGGFLAFADADSDIIVDDGSYDGTDYHGGTTATIGENAQISAKGVSVRSGYQDVNLDVGASTTAGGLTGTSSATAREDADLDARITVEGGGAVVEGLEGVDFRVINTGITRDVHADAVFYGLSAGDPDEEFDGATASRLDTADGATIIAGPRIAGDTELDVGDLGSLPSLALLAEIFSPDGTRTIEWNANVILLSGPTPTLVVNPDGKVVTAVNVKVDGGNGVGYDTGSTFTVDDIINDDRGQAMFKSNGTGSISETAGGYPLFTFRETYAEVSLVNESNHDMIVSDVIVVNRDEVTPEHEIFIRVSSDNAFEFDVNHDFKPTLVTVRNTDTRVNHTPDIKFGGVVDNPIGITVVENQQGDIFSINGGLIRTDSFSLTAHLGSVGTGNGTRLNLEVVESDDGPADPAELFRTVDAGTNVFLSMTGLLRRALDVGEGGEAGFVTDIDRISAGQDANLSLGHGIDQTTPATFDYQIEVNQAAVVILPTPSDLVSVSTHFRPGTDGPASIYPLGLFGTGSGTTNVTYQIGDLPDPDKRLEAGDDIDVNGPTTGSLVNFDAITDLLGLGEIDVTTNGNVDIIEAVSDLRVGLIKSTEEDVTLTAPDGSILDRINDADDDNIADVVGQNITLVASAGIGDPCNDPVPVNFLEIDSSFSGAGVLNATADSDIYIEETLGVLRIDAVHSDLGDVVLRTQSGSMVDAGAGNNVEARSIDLVAVGGGIGEIGNDLDIDTDHTGSPNATGSGRLYARATNSIYLTETDEELDVLQVVSETGDVRLTVPDESSTGENFNLLGSGETLECVTLTEGRVDAGGSVRLNVGDNVTTTATSTIIAGTTVDVYGDRNGIANSGQSDNGVGTTMFLQGTIETRGSQAGERANFYGNVDNDTFFLNDLQLNTQTNMFGSNTLALPAGGANEVSDVDGRDTFTVNHLRTMATHRNGLDSGVDRRDTLNLDGQGDTDTYAVFTGGSLGGNTGGEMRDYIISVLDSGREDDGEDVLSIDGSADADIFLLRQLSQLKAGQEQLVNANEYYRVHGGTPPDGTLSMGYVALLHGVDGTAPGQIRETDGLTGYVTNGAPAAVERVNYTENINARLIVRGLGGDDVFATDDNAAITTLDGGLGEDTFQIGQMYGAPRVAPPNEAAGIANPPGLAAEDSFSTIRTTRGDLSHGVSFSLVAMGDKGDDIFTVYSNKAEIRLEGNDDNDTFIVRAFALADQDYHVLTFGGVSTENTTLVQPGDGDDLVQYNINAPVDVDGGRGFDRLVVLGTEFGDNFVITDEAIWGAGLKVTYENVEAVEVDGLEGNDQFFVLSTAPRVITTVIGGLGSDTIDIAGDVTGPIQARELEGRGSMINHTVTSVLDDGYDGLNAPGVRLNIATPDNGAVVITESDDSTVVSESATTDSYTVRLGKQLLGDEVVYVTVSASRTLSREEALGGDSMTVSTAGGPDDKYAVLKFDASNWDDAQTVTVKGVNDGLAEGERVYAISHTVQSNVESYNHLAVKNVKVTVLDNDKPDIQVIPDDFQTLVLEGGAGEGITDTYTVKLATVPIGTVWVKLEVDTSQMTISTVNAGDAGRLQFAGGFAYVRFDAVTNSAVGLRMTAVDDGVAENRGWSTITHSVSSDVGHATTDADYLSNNPDIKPVKQYLDVEVVDNDTPGVLVTESNGRTLIVQDTDDLNNASQDDTYTIRLTMAPSGPVTVWLNDDGQTILTPQGIDPARVVTNPTTGKTGVVFNATNWATAVTINVHAVNDYDPTPLEEVLIPFPKSEHLLNDLRGPLFIEGGVSEADRSIAKPVMLPDEISPPPKDIGPQAPEQTRIDVVRVYNDASVTNDVGFIGDGAGALPYTPRELDGGTPNMTRMSGLSASADWFAEGYNPDGTGVLFQGGVSSHGIERFELLLGQGHDNLSITNTLFVTGANGNPALYGGLTVVHGGGGNDTITVTGQAGGADSPLVVYGDTSADGYRYSWTGADGTTISENATGFDNPGNDLLDAAGALGTVTLYGGRGNDRLIGGAAGDHLAGGSGDDIIVGNGGNDHIYGDSGFNVDLVSRRFGADMSGLPNWFVKDGDDFLFDNTFMFDPDGDGPLGLRGVGLGLLDPGKADDMTAWLVDNSRETWLDSLDAGNDLINAGDGNDIVFGDHGIIKQTNFGALSNLLPSLDRKVLGTGTGLAAASNNITLVESRSNQNGGVDTVFAGNGEDIVIGGANGDNLDGQDGKDLIFGDNVALDRSDSKGDLSNPRFRVLAGTTIYSTVPGISSGASQVTGAWQADPDGSAVWTDYRVELENHDSAAGTPALLSSGNDYVAGGSGNDQIFGEMGNDTIQGDGSIGVFVGSHADRYATAGRTPTAFGAYRTPGGAGDPVGPLTVNASFEAATDGDDYIEGNGGADVIFGNLGQDDIIGGTSTMFGETTAAERPDGADLIFGGAGTDISHNNVGDATVGSDGTITPAANGHSRDADMILGDNGDIHRLVGVNGAVGVGSSGVAISRGFLAFNYDGNRPGEPASALRIVGRAATLVDYTTGGPDYNPVGAATDIGGNDEVHGESGDDFIYGMKGSDILFGDGQDDDLIGNWGSDWISGGTGSDGVLGDDGRIYTSRNSATYGEPLNGVAALLATDPDTRFSNGNVINELITTPGNAQMAIINVANQLKKTVDLTPFNLDPSGIGSVQDPLYRPHNADDIIYGGLGNDFLHGGAGDDAISGAEALAGTNGQEGWTQLYNGPGNTLSGAARSDFSRPYNPSDALRWNPDDLDGWHRDTSRRSGEFALYDEYDPRTTIRIDTVSGAKVGATLGGAFFLNFNPTQGVALPGGTAGTGGQTVNYGPVNSDGDDAIFGDLGNDWIVGGTGRDDLYGGYGNDLLNADDDHRTAGGLNDVPDTHPSYEDRAFGGAGRDVLIGNTGGDRLIDWVGEFNSYLVPFAPFGTATVSRTLQPQLAEFLYALSAGDGADATRDTDQGLPASDPRNGEPGGELGLLRQQDPDFHDQTGAPTDPQAGNIPGGKRDVLRSASFDDGQAQGFMVDSGVFSVTSSMLQVEAGSKGKDAVAVYQTGEYLPSYYEMLSSVKVVKATAGWKSDAYLIFDYVSYTDFKYAGFDIATNKLVIGHRDASGWVVDKQVNINAKADTFYNMKLMVNGVNASITFNNGTTLTHTFVARVVDGYAYGLNWGLVGVGSDNSRGVFDNVSVQVVPPQASWTNTENFSDGVANLFPASGMLGTWVTTSGVGGNYTGTPGAGGLATTRLDIGPDNLQLASMLSLTAKVSTQTTAGFIFDQYSATDFKYVVIDQVNDKVLIGHSLNGKWVTDASFNKAIVGGQTYTLGVTLVGTTVSVTLDGAVIGGKGFNAVVVDGQFGLMTKGGVSTFDDVTVKTNDPQMVAPPASPMLAAETSVLETNLPNLTQAQLDAIGVTAMAMWRDALGDGDPRLAALGNLRLTVADLVGNELGHTEGQTITLDINAAGHGWYVDPTAADNSEFIFRLDRNVLSADTDSEAFSRMDLLTVVLHEVGHVLGFDHDDASRFAVMDDDLEPGIRYLLDNIGFDGDPDQPISDAALFQFARRAALWEEGVAWGGAGKLPPAFDWGSGVAAAGAAVDWQEQSGSSWGKSYSPFGHGKSGKGSDGNFSDFFFKLVNGNRAASSDMGEQLGASKAKPKAEHM